MRWIISYLWCREIVVIAAVANAHLLQFSYWFKPIQVSIYFGFPLCIKPYISEQKNISRKTYFRKINVSEAKITFIEFAYEI